MSLGPHLRPLCPSMLKAILSFVLSTSGIEVLIKNQHIYRRVELETKVYEAPLDQAGELHLVLRVYGLVHQDEDPGGFVIGRTGKVASWRQ